MRKIAGYVSATAFLLTSMPAMAGCVDVAPGKNGSLNIGNAAFQFNAPASFTLECVAMCEMLSNEYLFNNQRTGSITNRMYKAGCITTTEQVSTAYNLNGLKATLSTQNGNRNSNTCVTGSNKSPSETIDNPSLGKGKAKADPNNNHRVWVHNFLIGFNQFSLALDMDPNAGYGMYTKVVNFHFCEGQTFWVGPA
jgi:hypothetical protein